MQADHKAARINAQTASRSTCELFTTLPARSGARVRRLCGAKFVSCRQIPAAELADVRRSFDSLRPNQPLLLPTCIWHTSMAPGVRRLSSAHHDARGVLAAAPGSTNAKQTLPARMDPDTSSTTFLGHAVQAHLRRGSSLGCALERMSAPRVHVRRVVRPWVRFWPWSSDRRIDR